MENAKRISKETSIDDHIEAIGNFIKKVIKRDRKMSREEQAKLEKIALIIIEAQKKKNTGKKHKKKKIPTFKPQELQSLIGIIAIGGDAVKDAERYYE